MQEKRSQECCRRIFQTIENAAQTVQTQFGVNYEISEFTTITKNHQESHNMELPSFLGSVSSWYPSQSTCESRKPRQVLQTLLTMYRCSSRVLAEPEAGLPTKCRSTDHICCFETSQFALWHPLNFAYCSCFSFSYGKPEKSRKIRNAMLCRVLWQRRTSSSVWSDSWPTVPSGEVWSNCRVEMPPFVKQSA